MCLQKTRSEKLFDSRDAIVSLVCTKNFAFKKFISSTSKLKASVFKFLPLKQRFPKAPFSWRINVDGRPSGRNKVKFSNSSSLLWTERQSSVILDLCLGKIWGGKSRDYLDAMFFKRLRFQIVFRTRESAKPAFFKFLQFEECFREARFRD